MTVVRHREWGKWLRYYLLFRPLAALPFPLAYRAANLIGDIDCRRDHGARRAVTEGLVRIFPQLRDDTERLQGMLRNHFRMKARELMDVFTMPRFNRDNVGSVIRIEGLDVLRAAQQQNKGVILVMAHYSRLNMLLLGVALAGRRLSMLTMPLHGREPHYLDPVDRRFLRHKVGTLLNYLGGSWFTLDDNLRQLFRSLERGETLVVLLDAFSPAWEKLEQAPFFGGDLAVSRMIRRLAQRTDARLVYGVAHEEGWRIRAELRPLPEPPADPLAAAAAELERDVRACPWRWWHWGVLPLMWRGGAESGN